MDRLISASEAARRLNISQASMSRWVRAGRVPGAVKVANMWLVPENLKLDDIDRPRMGRPKKKSEGG